MNIEDLKNIFLFKNLQDVEIELILSSGRKVEYDADTLIFSEGATGDALYLIITGFVKITKQIDATHEETLAILKDKDYFGEMALIDDDMRSASAITTAKTYLYRIDRDNFKTITGKNKELGLKVLGTIAKIAIKRLREANNRFSDITRKGKVVREEVEKMKSGIISLISHELRTPLTVIKGSAKILETDDISIENKNKFLTKIERQSNKLTKIVDNLITLSVMQYSEMDIRKENVDLIRIIKKIITEVGALAEEKGIDIELTASQSLPFVNVDREGMNKVLYNLLDNAIKFTPDNGKVCIEAIYRPDSKTGEKQIVIAISDTGVGIAKENLETIFDPFSQQEEHLTRTFGGAGIGLPIVKSIINAHRGEVWVESKEGQGSKFIFTLPVE